METTGGAGEYQDELPGRAVSPIAGTRGVGTQEVHEHSEEQPDRKATTAAR
jgi:hypothetical protein